VASSLILASRSPRRRELLAAAEFEFESVSTDVDEKFDVDLTLRELTLFNALRKGMAVARLRPESVVLAADTLVAIDGEVIGKPLDLDHAGKILRRLSGRVHEVCSAVFICHLAGARSTSFCEISRVRFRRLNTEKIDNCLAKVNPLDKAGAYAAQGRGAEIIERIDGSFTNVVGLPMERVLPALAIFGITPAATSSR
jgi:nucleoside triphosphate pyrophosphatase